MGASTRPVLVTLPVRAKIVVPFDVRPYAAEPFAVEDYLRYIRPGFNVVDVCRFSPKARVGREGWAGLGMPRLPSIEAMRAVSPQTGPAPSLIWRWKEKSVPMMLSPMRPAPRLFYGGVKALDKGVLGPAVDVTFVGAYDVGADEHPRRRCGVPLSTDRSLKAPGPRRRCTMYFLSPGPSWRTPFAVGNRLLRVP